MSDVFSGYWLPITIIAIAVIAVFFAGIGLSAPRTAA